jgi:gamma-glutamylcyclotransferase (GGCT)/AIG2-like uncharacterized protein YtfP
MPVALILLAAWSANSWNAAGQAVLAVGAIVAAGWAVFTYRRAKRAEAARWLQSLFRDFYTDPTIVSAREILEYDFEKDTAQLLEWRVTDRDVPLDDGEREKLRQIDLVLNYFEQLLYLESQKLIARHDREVFFQYWFELMREPGRAALRRYLAQCGYERCAEWIKADSSEYIAVYGSLMDAYSTQDDLDVREMLELIGPCVIEGRLFSRGEFPCIVRGNGHVEGQLFAVRDRAVFRVLDELEHYDASNPAGSKYRRHCVQLIEPAKKDAWIYVWNSSDKGLVPIPSGSWADFKDGGESGVSQVKSA